MGNEFKFDDNKPIYKQLVEQFTEKIINGVYEKESKLPSVREFALITNVNPNTVARALTYLEEKNLIETRRTNGKFVTDDEKIIEKEKEEVLNNKISNFLIDMKKFNITKEEVIDYLKKYEEEL